MSLKKLAAGSGYEYLTRQVAVADSTELGRMKLADYYRRRDERIPLASSARGSRQQCGRP